MSTSDFRMTILGMGGIACSSECGIPRTGIRRSFMAFDIVAMLVARGPTVYRTQEKMLAFVHSTLTICSSEAVYPAVFVRAYTSRGDRTCGGKTSDSKSSNYLSWMWRLLEP